MNEDDIANKILDELKDEGYKSLEDKYRDIQFKRALQDYERHLNCPYG